jgi:hypothetical protein
MRRFNKPILWMTRCPAYPPLREGDMDYSRALIQSLATLTPVRGVAFRAEDAPRPSVLVGYLTFL